MDWSLTVGGRTHLSVVESPEVWRKIQANLDKNLILQVCHRVSNTHIKVF